MMCTLCGHHPVQARGLCASCYRQEKKADRLDQYSKRQRQQCAVAGCGLLASSKGLCKNHAERHRRGTLERKLVPDLPGERWAAIDGHPGWQVSTAGRIKSGRSGHERLLKARMVDGRLLAGDHGHGNITVHLAVLRAFRPDGEADGGKAVFMDGEVANAALENLRWETTTDRVRHAIAMAEASTSPWAAEFAAFWRGDKNALDRFFTEMWRLLLASYHAKARTYRHYYQAEAGEYASATIFRAYLSIKRGALQTLDNLPAWILTAGDRVLLQHNLYARYFVGLEGGDPESDSTVADMIGWTMPSPETVLLGKEEILYRNAAANHGLPGTV
jgi:hypothetical protein